MPLHIPRSTLEMFELLAGQDVDRASRQFFTALLGVMERTDVAPGIIVTVQGARPHVTDEHLAWLIFASLQYVTDCSYDSLVYMDISTIEESLARDLALYKEDVVRLCSSKYLCTNVINRYAALQVVLSLMYRGSSVSAVDIGCSVGLGLMSLNTDHLYSTRVPDTLLDRALRTPVKIDVLVGVDIQEPDLNWLRACYLPEYVDQRRKALELHDSLRAQGREFRFLKCDVLDLEQIATAYHKALDVVWISNTCYQVEGDLDHVEHNIRSVLKDDGVWLYAYYRKKQPGWISEHNTDANPYVVGLYPGGTRRKYLEILQADNDEVKVFARGKDFDQFYRDFTR